jgi:hypothetical protein
VPLSIAGVVGRAERGASYLLPRLKLKSRERRTNPRAGISQAHGSTVQGEEVGTHGRERKRASAAHLRAAGRARASSGAGESQRFFGRPGVSERRRKRAAGRGRARAGGHRRAWVSAGVQLGDGRVQATCLCFLTCFIFALTCL